MSLGDDEQTQFGYRPFHERYRVLRTLGKGGMAVVFEGYDSVLGRSVALKQCLEDPERFEREILLSARIEHPNIVAVHDAGMLDGVLTFVMPVIEGKTFRELITAREKKEDIYDRPVTLQRLVDALRIVCDAVGFAHGRAVIHRDLKPPNLMLGPHGEVHVLDWGIATIMGEEENSAGLTDIYNVQGQTDAILGTPGYLAPENFEYGEYSPASDVFSLGVVLFQLLTHKSPFRGKTPYEMLMALKLRRRRAIRGRLRIPRGLADVCRKALEWEPEDRYQDGTEMARALEAWLEGSKQRDADWNRADELVDQAASLIAQMKDARARGAAVRRTAATKPIHNTSPLSDKEARWADEERAEAAELSADLAEAHALDLLHTAAATAPGHERSLTMICTTLKEAHARAEKSGQAREAARLGHTLRFYDEAERYKDYLDGLVPLTLQTIPPARATISALEPEGRRRLPSRFRSLGTTPLQVELQRGSYLLKLHADGFPRILVPVLLQREGAWPPFGEDLVLLPETVGTHERYIPPGPFFRRTEGWANCDGMMMHVHPVTHQEWSTFVKEAGGPPTRVEGQPRWPVVGITRTEARAYAEWWSSKTGLPWRLPTALEWEKAAGGVDGRPYVWGDFADCSWGRFRDSVAIPCRQAVGATRLDASVYGIRGMAGNVSEWVESAGSGDLAAGASWQDDPIRSLLGSPRSYKSGSRHDTVGFRLVRSWPT